ncbi:hypothetical protein Q4Q34_07365 [Flavivirga abyssicola]|uniref:hypothetical protein n=1 Tax=Flavivirga abyssicola TaxID=3063533 RepID=UPI0026E10B94|nr:hypothetical protein [Flavivirga sp. MEBiC07777]WVK14844.1 hypothetical protein Q4Q34_07365 [Flavivirga sp. MEBiC07777]
MKTLTLILLVLPLCIFSQDMNNEKLDTIYTTVSDSIQGKPGAWQFFVKEIPLMSITDTNHNRMRIISPIADSSSLSDELIKAALVANFHTALDVKYAVSDGVLWSVFIHPLKELSEHQVKDAVSQVYYAHINFGTTFASTALTFPGRVSDSDNDVEKEKEQPRFKKL